MLGTGALAARFLTPDPAWGSGLWKLVTTTGSPRIPVVITGLPPRHIPLWLARLAAGEAVVMMTESRGASNAKAKKELGWTLRHPSWRQGFTATYGQPRPLKAAA